MNLTEPNRRRVVRFPLRAYQSETAGPLNREPVQKIEEKSEFNPKLGGVQHTFRLSIAPWDLQKIIKAANQLGLEGKPVIGFGYDYDAECIYVEPQ